MALEFLSYLGAVILLLWLVRAVIVVVRGEPMGFLWDPDKHCGKIGVSCGAFTGFATPILSLALASSVFLFYRLRTVKRRYTKKALRYPNELVQTAGSLAGEVVGRDDLCRAVIENVHDREGRRAHIIIGGVGTGKTATLVQLTQMLAARRAVPVPVRLRDARSDLDFEKLARSRFLEEVNDFLLSSGEGEKVWRQLRKDERVVVIADGLEEALIGDEDRDSLIRLATRRANDQRLPVIIASRPHDPLRDSGGAIMELEPLSEEAALTYLATGHGDDYERLRWIVERADVAAVPIYLQITRQLREKNRLRHVSPGTSDVLDPRDRDQSGLRQNLLETWMRALTDGHLKEELPLTKHDRAAAIDQLSALAAMGLEHDELVVSFQQFDAGLLDGAGDGAQPDRSRHFIRRRVAQTPPSTSGNTHAARAAPPKEMYDEVLRRNKDQGWPQGMDIRLAAAIGGQLGLVEANREGVRFLHSVMQAYLGSRLIRHALKDPTFCQEAMRSAGREFLIALVLDSRAERRTRAREHAAALRRPPPARAAAHGTGQGRGSGAERDVRDLLLEAAAPRTDVSALDMYAAALEIDSVDDDPKHGVIARAMADRWSSIRATDPRTLEESKLGVVRRFGSAARELSQRRERESTLDRPAYDQLLRVGYEHIAQSRHASYRVRHAVAQEIGMGGDDAFDQLRSDLTERAANNEPVKQPAAAPDSETRKKKRSTEARRNDTAPVRAGTALDGEMHENQGWRKDVMCAWLAPLLVGSVRERRQEAEENLETWLERVEGSAGSRQLDISLQIALAQGFKYAANRGPRHPHSSPEARTFLVEQAVELLKRSDFWFSQLTLVHALCLWTLCQQAGTAQPTTLPKQPGGRGYRARPRELVQSWLEIAGTAAHREQGARERKEGHQTTHPFVAEAARLSIAALETREPERFVWIDESGVVAKVGSRPSQGAQRETRRLWIPSSTGWAALHPSAQRLVADVLLLLNLAERGDSRREVEMRLKRANRSDLPPCITTDRRRLDPGRTVGAAETSEPGTNCMEGCRFGLCPYPPKGSQSYREEFGEAFCRRQETLFGRGRTAPWQGVLPRDLRRFWEEMSDRSRR